MNIQLGFKFSCTGVLPQVRRVRIIILLIILLAWAIRGTLIVLSYAL